jgi:hypothetical protein
LVRRPIGRRTSRAKVCRSKYGKNGPEASSIRVAPDDVELFLEDAGAPPKAWRPEPFETLR